MDLGLMRRLRLRWLLIPGLLGLLGCGGDEEIDLGPAVERGSVTITWRLFDSTGDETTCGAVGAVDAYVALGGEPRIVDCGDEQRVEFADLVPQRYPVVLRLRGLAESTLPQGEIFDNVIVEGSQNLDLPLEVRFDENSGSTGSVRFAWLVDSQTASLGCEAVGATTVHAESTAAAVAPFSFDADCADGEHLQANMRPGNYEAALFLRDAAGETLSARGAAFRVLRRNTTDVITDFSADNRPRAAMRARWTVSSSAAAEACRSDWSVRLLLQEDRQTPIETATATATCDRGEYLFEDLPSPSNPATDRYKLTVTLVEELRGDLDYVTVDDLPLRGSETTTVSVDLVPPG